MPQVMQYGRYAPASGLRVAGVIAAVPAVLIVGVVAAHRASAPSLQPVGARRTTRAVHPRPVGARAGGQSLSAGIPVDPSYFSPGACVAFRPAIGNRSGSVPLRRDVIMQWPGRAGRHSATMRASGAVANSGSARPQPTSRPQDLTEDRPARTPGCTGTAAESPDT